MAQETRKSLAGLSPDVIRELISHYGSAYSELLKYPEADSQPRHSNAGTLSVLKAEVLYAIREEMAQKLTDVVFRRATLGMAKDLTDYTVTECADVMADELGWSEERRQEEIREVKHSFLWGHDDHTTPHRLKLR